MSLVDTYRASNMMQDLVKATYWPLNHDVSIVPLLYCKKIESQLETYSSNAQRINITFVT